MSQWGNYYNSFESVHFQAPVRVQVNGAGIDFTELEAESSMQIRAITRKDGLGGERIVAYRMDLTLYLPNNRYTDYQADLLLLQNTPLVDLDITFSDFPEAGPNDDMTLDAGISGSVPARTNTLLSLSCGGWTIETIERRARIIIPFRAIYSVRLFEAAVLPYFMNYY